MGRTLTALGLVLLLTLSSAYGAALVADGVPLGEVPIYEDTAYVPLRAVAEALRPDSTVTWEKGRAMVRESGYTLTARPGDPYLYYNGEPYLLPLPVRLEEDRVLVPVRPLCALLETAVTWSPAARAVHLTTGRSIGRWDQEDLYWLSHIISAESRGEPWEGQVAVGNVVLNRVGSPDFPGTIREVIFDDRWGGQFEPVRNGTVYLEPTSESALAALAALEGAKPVGESLYFLAPHLTENHWTMDNRDFVTTIGAHWFYQ